MTRRVLKIMVVMVKVTIVTVALEEMVMAKTVLKVMVVVMMGVEEMMSWR